MKIKLLIIVLLGAFSAGPSFAAGSHSVRGHVTKKGTYVAPTRATNPNGTQRDNYSSKPNVNPANGKQGTRTATR
jgi:hypothetical protein